MTDTTSPEALVTQGDRDAAAERIAVWGDVEACMDAHKVRQGEWDGHPLVQAFARHRQEALTALQSRIEELEAALTSYQRFAGETAGKCLGLAMSTEHPAPDEVLMGIFEASQTLANRARTTLTNGANNAG